MRKLRKTTHQANKQQQQQMASKQTQKNQNLREIYDLLDKLCQKCSPERHKEVLKKVTSGIVESQNLFFSNEQAFDETLIVAKIKNQISRKSNQSNIVIFLKLHEELSTFTFTQPKFRTSILTFLHGVSDFEEKFPTSIETSKDFSSSGSMTFTLPVRSQIQTSASMEHIFRNASSRVS